MTINLKVNNICRLRRDVTVFFFKRRDEDSCKPDSYQIRLDNKTKQFQNMSMVIYEDLKPFTNYDIRVSKNKSSVFDIRIETQIGSELIYC